MKRRLKAMGMAILLIAATLISTFTGITPVKAEELVLRLHYHRADGDYAPWDVWMWEKGKDGAGYAFEEIGGEMVATKELTPGTSEVGFIVRTQDWAKDVDADQYIDIAEMVSGTVDVYVESGVEGYEKAYGSDAVLGIKLKAASYNAAIHSVTVTMTGQLEDDPLIAFTVTGRGGQIDVAQVADKGDNSYILLLAEDLNIYHTYYVNYDGSSQVIRMPILYSTPEFEEEFTYTGDDLGATYTKESTTFRVWAPVAESMTLNLYESGMESQVQTLDQVAMMRDVNGTWVTEYKGDLNHVYYTYTASIDGRNFEACDPYARTTGVNGKRAMVLDLSETNPEFWELDQNPNAGKKITDAVIYEMHVRDFSVSEDSGMENKGKYLAFTEKKTTNASGDATGVDYLKQLGITHLHILPFYDFGSVDESRSSGYNWGYDPQNYNVPEGSYATDPYHGEVRVAEAKQMVKSLHDNGISVVMDVVYNHVYDAESFCVNKLTPGYFSRVDENGTYSNGSGCGNDTATERSMVKKYIVDSVNYWADEYHIDGFRFDLVGLMDVELMNEIIDTVHEKHPDVIFYGEGWNMETKMTKDGYYLATQNSSQRVPGLSFFNDSMRDGLKGNIFNNSERGYVSGAMGLTRQMTSAFMGSAVWCKQPYQSINYASCHDNLTLFDRLQTSCPDAGMEELVAMNNLAASFYLLSEGVPFVMGGEEMLRTKPNADGSLNSNSYVAGDEVNAIRWENLSDETYADTIAYYKGLIAFRKAHPSLRLASAEEVAELVVPVEETPDDVLAFQIEGKRVEGEISNQIFVIYNPNKEAQTVQLPKGRWTICIDKENAGTAKLGRASKKVTVDGVSTMVLVKGNATLDDSPVLVIVVLVFMLGVFSAIVTTLVKRHSRLLF